MAGNIPTILADREIQTGSTGPHATADQFGPDFSGLGAGLEHFGRGIDHAATAMAVVEKKKQLQKDASWATESIMQERMNMAEWMSKPENNSDPEFSNNFKKYAIDRLGEYQKTAPSPEASTMFRQHMGDFIDRQYQVSLQATEKTRLNNSILSIDNSIQDALKLFRDSQSVPGADPVTDLEDSLHIIHDGIQTQFGDVSPVTTQRLQEHLVKEAVLGIAPSNPDAAKSILNRANGVDEETRRSLLSVIEQSTKSRDIVGQDQFARDRRDHVAAVFFGKANDKMPLDVYELYYDKDHAQVMKAHDDELIDTYVRANGIVDSLRGKNATAHVEALTDLQAKASTEQDKNVLEVLQPRIRQELVQMQKNRVGWMSTNNPSISVIQGEIDAETDDNRKQELMMQKNSLLLQYQGHAPADGKDAEFYMNLPSHDRHLMTSDEAGGYAAQINKAAPSEVVRTINGILAKYPDSAHQYIAFNDMVSIPQGNNGIKQEYQLAFQNKDAWWLDTYVASLSNVKGLATLDDERRKNIFAEVEKHPMWKQFQGALIGDNFERTKEIEGYKSGILAYTHALTLSGKPMKEAANSAVNMLIGESLGFADVNGQSLVIARERSDKTRRDPEDVRDIGRRLGMSLKYVDPREIDGRHFPGLAALGNEGSVERMQGLRDIITSRGFFVTGNDGQSASLHLRDDNGVPFEVTDKSGKPLTIHFDNLPEFTYQVPNTVMPSSTAGGPIIVPGQHTSKDFPRKTYDLKSGGDLWDKMFGSGRAITNWPTAAPWIQHDRNIPTFTPERAPITKPPPSEDPMELLKGVIAPAE